jgi:hypothetical protein
MGYPYKPTNGAVFVTLRVADVGTAETILFCPGFSGRIKRITSCIAGAITGSDSGWTTKIGTTTVTGGGATVTVSGSAAGDVDQAIPTALNNFSATDFISLVNDGVSTGPQPMMVAYELEPN